MDSGLGGLSVWREIRALLPRQSTLYISDHRYMPYGTKTTEYIRRRVLAILLYMKRQEVKLAVIACNTATVAGIAWYREKIPDMPIIGVVPVVKTAVSLTKTKQIAVLCTPFTARSKYLDDLIRQFASDCQVSVIQAPGLVELVESGEISTIEVTRLLREYICKLNNSVDIIVMGSTHFAFLCDSFRTILGERYTVLDSGAAVARHVKRVLEARRDTAHRNAHTDKFVTTGDAKAVSLIAEKLLFKPVVFTHATI